jgi:hypothetical protein
MYKYFTDDDCWTKEALDLTNEIADFLEPIFERQAKKGLSNRQTAHVIMGAVFEAEIKAVLDKK